VTDGSNAPTGGRSLVIVVVIVFVHQRGESLNSVALLGFFFLMLLLLFLFAGNFLPFSLLRSSEY